MNWKGKSVLVTGGASFISSHLVDSLIALGAKVRVVDDLSSGKLSNIQQHINTGNVEFMQQNLLHHNIAKEAVKDIDVVFHLAAHHGGRGFVDLHQVECAKNLRMDNALFDAACDAGVKKVVFASSGCVYPNYKQQDVTKEIYLKEDDVGPPYDADNTYGWAKLMAELTLKAYYKEHGLKSASCRFFTVYGERGVENHAVIAMIARAFTQKNPFEVWGTGEQLRNWTYVGDIVRGSILAAENIHDASAVNLGTTERIRVLDAAKMIIEHVKQNYYPEYSPTITTLPHMPTGPLNRIADNSLSKELLGNWQQVNFKEGLQRTINWYFKNRTHEAVEEIFSKNLLAERL